MNSACIVKISLPIPPPAQKTAFSANAPVRLKSENSATGRLTMLTFQCVISVVLWINRYNLPTLFLEFLC